jgi:hypothetical protein
MHSTSHIERLASVSYSSLSLVLFTHVARQEPNDSRTNEGGEGRGSVRLLKEQYVRYSRILVQSGAVHARY